MRTRLLSKAVISHYIHIIYQTLILPFGSALKLGVTISFLDIIVFPTKKTVCIAHIYIYMHMYMYIIIYIYIMFKMQWSVKSSLLG